MSEISRDQVAHLAKLSRLALSQEELDSYSEQIDTILGHVKAIQDIDTSQVEAMSHPVSVTNVVREDVIRPGLTCEQALDQAPRAEGDRFIVPQILSEGGAA